MKTVAHCCPSFYCARHSLTLERRPAAGGPRGTGSGRRPRPRPIITTATHNHPQDFADSSVACGACEVVVCGVGLRRCDPVWTRSIIGIIGIRVTESLPADAVMAMSSPTAPTGPTAPTWLLPPLAHRWRRPLPAPVGGRAERSNFRCRCCLRRLRGRDVPKCAAMDAVAAGFMRLALWLADPDKAEKTLELCKIFIEIRSGLVDFVGPYPNWDLATEIYDTLAIVEDYVLRVVLCPVNQ